MLCELVEPVDGNDGCFLGGIGPLRVRTVSIFNTLSLRIVLCGFQYDFLNAS